MEGLDICKTKINLRRGSDQFQPNIKAANTKHNITRKGEKHKKWFFLAAFKWPTRSLEDDQDKKKKHSWLLPHHSQTRLSILEVLPGEHYKDRQNGGVCKALHVLTTAAKSTDWLATALTSHQLSPTSSQGLPEANQSINKKDIYF